MPTQTKRRGQLRWRGVVKMNGRIVRSKWFGQGKREQKKALLWEEETRKAILKEQERSVQGLTLLDLAVSYLEHVKTQCVKKTYQEKHRAFERLLERVTPIPLDKMSTGRAYKHLAAEMKARSGNAANKDRKNLASAWAWGQRYLDGFPEKANPFKSVAPFKVDPRPRYVPREEDFWKVYGVAKGQDRVMLTAFLHLAARKSELFRLTWRDVDFKNERVCLSTKKTKGGGWRYDWLPMTSELKRQLMWWWEHRTHKRSDYVFTVTSEGNGWNQHEGEPFKVRQHFMEKKCKAAGVRCFDFHAIRHLSASVLYRSGEKLSVIQEVLRHTSPSTTERYLKSLGFDLNNIRQAVEVFNGRGPAKVLSFAKEKAPEAATSGA